jgi:hypothetical protein
MAWAGTILPLGSSFLNAHINLSTFDSNTLNLCSALILHYQVSYPHKWR